MTEILCEICAMEFEDKSLYDIHKSHEHERKHEFQADIQANINRYVNKIVYQR